MMSVDEDFLKRVEAAIRRLAPSSSSAMADDDRNNSQESHDNGTISDGNSDGDGDWISNLVKEFSIRDISSGGDSNESLVHPPRKKTKTGGEHDEGPETKQLSSHVQDNVSLTLAEFAIFILENCGDEEDLSDLIVQMKDGFCERMSFDASVEFKTRREAFKDSVITACQVGIRRVSFRESTYKDSITKWEANELFSSTRDQLIEKLKKELHNVLPKIVGDTASGIYGYDEDLVEVDNEAALRFPLDIEKGQAVVIAGESGSGKSWFAKRGIPAKFKDASILYHEIRDEDVDSWDKNTLQMPENDEVRRCYTDIIWSLWTQGEMSSDLYHSVSELSRRNNTSRNEHAKILLNEIIAKSLQSSQVALAWWKQSSTETNTSTLNQLIIIIDEIGKIPSFALALVDEVRHISCDIQVRGVAENILLVLVGSGLDGYFNAPDISVNSKEDLDELRAMTSFGTDPSRCSLVTLQSPKLTESRSLGGVPLSDILKGSCSKVLATNTRMLCRGIIPIMQDQKLLLGFKDVSSRRIELGSKNDFMDYAARVYVSLNGLGRLQSDALDLLLQQQFLLILREKLVNVDSINPAFEKTKRTFTDSLPEEAYRVMLQYGIVAATVGQTSNALRYLACKGQTAPLRSQDGIAFEIVLQLHLARLFEASHSVSSKEKRSYTCKRHELKEAWPPSSSKGGKKLLSVYDVEKEVAERLKDVADLDEDQLVEKLLRQEDIERVASLTNGVEEYDLVLRQGRTNAQGADVLVLSKRQQDDSVFLDLYQAKHYASLPSANSEKLEGALGSLGIYYEPKNSTFNFAPQTGKAGYCYIGASRFAEKLGVVLQQPVKIRDRIVVFSCPGVDLKNKPTWNDFQWSNATMGKLWIWTREMLEPTISALTPSLSAREDNIE